MKCINISITRKVHINICVHEISINDSPFISALISIIVLACTGGSLLYIRLVWPDQL